MTSTQRLKAAVALTATACAVAVPAAAAQSGTNLEMTLHERYNAPCAIIVTLGCGSGEVIGDGQVTETIEFGAACNGACDLRTITFAHGTLVLDETASGCTLPGHSYNQPPTASGHPFSCALTDTVDGAASDGTFANATGTLSGEVRDSGVLATIQLSGTVDLS
jgi:hypothetical protein